MTGQPQLEQARELLEQLRPEEISATGHQVITLLELWDFRSDGLAGQGGAFMIHRCHVHLQMDVPTRGRVHRYVIDQAIGLVDCVRVLK